MADRSTGVDAVLSFSLPGGSDTTVLVSVYDSVDVAILNGATPVSLGSSRFSVTIPAAQMTREGVWRLEAKDSVSLRTVGFNFTVGPRLQTGLSKHDLRIQVASRLSRVLPSVVSDYLAGGLVDESLIGGRGSYVGWWIIPGPGHPESGVPRRVVSTEGSTLNPTHPWDTPLPPGLPYTLIEADPREVDNAIATAIADIRQTGRIKTTVADVRVQGGIAPVPRGLRYVSEVWDGTTLLGPREWELIPGRQISVPSSGIRVTLVGLRDLLTPVWEDSHLDTEPAAIIARSAHILHATRAAGPATDTSEHLRRQLTAFDEYERTIRRTSGRMVPNARVVQE